MNYVGDFAEDSTFDIKFNTKSLAQVPATLSGTPAVKCYKDNATGSETTAGLTLTVDFDSLTGLNNVNVDSSADAFYATGSDYFIVITTGTVDDISAIGQVVGHFSIENRFGADSAEIADAVLDEALSGHTTSGTLGQVVDEIETDLDVVLSTLSSMSASIVTIDGIVDDILVDTAEIGAAGAGLTDLGGMSTGMKAEVNTEADAALADYDSGNGVAKQDDLSQLSLAVGSPPDLGSGANLGANNTDMNGNVGAAGAGLTAIPWNSSWDAEVQSECADAIAAAEPIDANITQIAGSATVDTLTITEWFEYILSALAGDVVRSGDTYTYKKQNGSTTTFSYTITTGGRS